MMKRNDVTGHKEISEQISKQNWCSVGRGIYQRDCPLSFLVIIGLFIYAVVVFLVVVFEVVAG